LTFDKRIASLGESREAWAIRRSSEKRLSFERRVVKKVLAGCGITAQAIGRLCSSVPDENYDYTFAWLSTIFPQCPIKFVYYDKLSEVQVMDILQPRPRSQAVWKTWAEALDELGGDDGYAVGMAFTVVSSQEKKDCVETEKDVFILHNLLLPSYNAEGMQSEVRISNKDEKFIAYCQPLNSFTSRLALKWDAEK